MELSTDGELDADYFVSDLLDTIGWDILRHEIAVRDGVPLVFRGGSYKIFESFDNLMNLKRIQHLANLLTGEGKATESMLSQE